MERGRREEEGEEEEEEGLVELLLSSPSSCTSYSSNSFDICSEATVKEEKINRCMGWSSESKKAKKERFGSKGTIKARKERLGDKIAALQQLVSPFGKPLFFMKLWLISGSFTNRFRFWQVLSSPYLRQRLPTSASLQGSTAEGEIRLGDLQSRGLCLVPLTCTMHVPNSNGADLWAPSNPTFSITKPSS
ncbi:transcription factor bHLH113-like isoform X2 [Phalaenopsis equestris]|uniref:transcription factor bHLH113-like isoform X2 n=1 Tax=Phalaenopsis equestris TaxID=78828 RepID=UPI0009E441AB|nr:transcription factor bHLH113-like isoform X2 [Phalaenopsis equestris]